MLEFFYLFFLNSYFGMAYPLYHLITWEIWYISGNFPLFSVPLTMASKTFIPELLFFFFFLFFLNYVNYLVFLGK